MARVSTPWGQAERVGEATVPQRAGERRFSTVVELLEAESGERLVRFAYTTDGVVRRGPATLRERDVAKLWQAVRRAPALDTALRRGLDEHGLAEPGSAKQGSAKQGSTEQGSAQRGLGRKEAASE